MIIEDWIVYCPICGRDIEASNREEVKLGMDDSYMFVHDDVAHEEIDIEALANGIN